MRKKHKISIVLLMAVIVLIPVLFGGCEGAADYEYAGNYYAYDGDVKSDSAWYSLNQDGKWESFAGGTAVSSGTYTLQDGVIVFTPESGITMSGTLSADGILTVTVDEVSSVFKKDPPMSFGEMALSALFCFLMVFVLLAVIYLLIRLSSIIIQFLETKMKKLREEKDKKGEE